MSQRAILGGLTVLLMAILAEPGEADGDSWSSYGGGPGGGQYSAADQITPENVRELKIAWTLSTGDVSHGENGTRKTTFEVNPIYADGRIYICTPYNRVIAIEPESGRPQWYFEPEPKLARNYNQQHALICRGVSYWDSGDDDQHACSRRLFAPVLDGRIIALDARTGKPCMDFGDRGTVRLNDLDNKGIGVVNLTSPPLVYEGLVIVGSAIGDNQTSDMPNGIVRAFDARTGREVWSWDPIPALAARRTGSANAWAPLSVDTTTGTLFVPTSSPSPDYWGGDRLDTIPTANAVVALDAKTGVVLWSQQIVRHDLFDNDLPAQPALVTVRTQRGDVPAVAQATKMGQIYFLDRRTGAYVFETIERPVPQSDVPGERSAPTQPVPVLPPPIAAQGLSGRDAWGITPLDRGWCAAQIRSMRADGMYTPPSVRGSVQRPFFGGGSNWGGLAIDPERRIAFGNAMNLPQWVRLIPRDAEDLAGEGELGRQKGAPYAMRRGVLLSPLGIPCSAPPWGTISAVNIDTGQMLWSVPLGQVPLALGLLGPRGWGSPTIGGPIATASGLVFIAATMDAKIRAFNAWTGDEVWQHDLPFDGAATPMTFVSERDGMQYLLIAAGGSGLLRPRLGDAVVAFRLPR